MRLLDIKNINTGYGKKQIIFNVSFDVNKNDVVLFTGTNGSGKSTLLKAIYGLLGLWDKNGKIIFENLDITNYRPYNLIKLGIIYIPQKNELFDDLTVKENLEISCLRTISKKKIRNKIEEVLELLPILKTLLKLDCALLSGGERKHLTLGMALMNNPHLIMFDEPLAGVSPLNIEILCNNLEKIKNAGITMILTEHRIKLVSNLANKIIELKIGKINID